MTPPRSSAEIRQAYLAFFEQRDHVVVPSSSLVPSTHDPSVLLTTAGMQQFKPYFLGQEQAPHPRLASCQKCFRTTDIDQVGLTARHLTFFEMLGNFSVGDYFKREAIGYAWELSTQVFELDPDLIWITVFEGDQELGLGPDEDAIGHWIDVGVPAERIVRLPRSENFWQAGPVGPCGPCSELYLDRGPAFGGDDDRPGDDTERYLEFWNLVFMQYELREDGSLEPLPKQNIDTGMGLDRMAAIMQDVPSVFENDQLGPLVTLGEQLSGRSYGDDPVTMRALRVLADHGRAMTFLIADGVVPSNEDRGYILRRVMRRAIQQGRAIGLEQGFLGRFADVAIDVMGAVYPELQRERGTIHQWVDAEEESFGRTLEQGTKLLNELIEQARADGTSWISAEDSFRLHDTYGFPYDLTRELLHEQGLSVDDSGFEELMEEQRVRARTGMATAHGSERDHEHVIDFARGAGFQTRFVGYETTEVETTVGALAPAAGSGNGLVLTKFPESPFYAEGGGQVADSGVVESDSGRARVEDVYRLGDDQAVAVVLDAGEIRAGERVRLRVDRRTRHATAANHTATHLLHAALRERLGTHVRQAGSAVRPDKLRFDFTHGHALSPEDLRAIEDRVNEWVLESRPVRALHTTRTRAEELGAMALFGEKYGDEVRMVEVEGVSRELCGGTHVGVTSEIALFKIVSEGSSAANVRRVEAVTGPEAVGLVRRHDDALGDVAAQLRTRPEDAPQTLRTMLERAQQLERDRRSAGAGQLDAQVDSLLESAAEVGGLKVLAASCEGAGPEELRDLSDRVRSRLGDAAVVLGSAGDGRAHLVANFARSATERGLSAVEVVRQAAQEMGGGGGGRDTMAQAGGRDPGKLEQALATAREAIESKLS
jgi:alanyl-tRNA synthetase